MVQSAWVLGFPPAMVSLAGNINHIKNKESTMKTDIVTMLRGEIAGAMANLKICQTAYKGIKAFKGNEHGIEFCAAQLYQAASALRDAGDQLAALADNLHDSVSDMPQPLELDDRHLDGRP